MSYCFAEKCSPILYIIIAWIFDVCYTICMEYQNANNVGQIYLMINFPENSNEFDYISLNIICHLIKITVL
jgi:hypothetical protein